MSKGGGPWPKRPSPKMSVAKTSVSHQLHNFVQTLHNHSRTVLKSCGVWVECLWSRCRCGVESAWSGRLCEKYITYGPPYSRPVNFGVNRRKEIIFAFPSAGRCPSVSLSVCLRSVNCPSSCRPVNSRLLSWLPWHPVHWRHCDVIVLSLLVITTISVAAQLTIRLTSRSSFVLELGISVNNVRIDSPMFPSYLLLLRSSTQPKQHG